MIHLAHTMINEHSLVVCNPLQCSGRELQTRSQKMSSQSTSQDGRILR